MAKYFKRHVVGGDYNNILHFKKLESDVEKRLFCEENTYVDILKVEDSPQRKMWLVYRLTPIRRGNSAFVKCDTISKVSYRKDVKKYFYTNPTLFFGSKEMLRTLGVDFVSQQGVMFLTKTIIKDIFNGRITNNTQIIKKYFYSVGMKNISVEKVLKVGNNPKYVLSLIYNAVNIEATLDYIINYTKDFAKKQHIFTDLQKEAGILGKKVDVRWSLNRMKEVHSEWSKEISALKIKSMVYKKVEYKNEIPTIEGIEFLDDNLKVYEEGRVMNHCVYSANYFQNVIEKRDVLLKYDRLGVRATAQVSFDKKSEEVKIKQFYGYKNTNVHEEHKMYLQEQLNKQEFKEFLKEELEESYNYSHAEHLPW